MNEYIEECWNMWKEIKKANEWFLRQLGYTILRTVKEAVEVVRNA